MSEKLEGLDEQERNNEAVAFKVAAGTSAYVPRRQASLLVLLEECFK